MHPSKSFLRKCFFFCCTLQAFTLQYEITATDLANHKKSSTNPSSKTFEKDKINTNAEKSDSNKIFQNKAKEIFSPAKNFSAPRLVDSAEYTLEEKIHDVLFRQTNLTKHDNHTSYSLPQISIYQIQSGFLHKSTPKTNRTPFSFLANDFTKKKPDEEKLNESFFAPCRGTVFVRHIDGGGVGYNTGYTTLEGMVFPVISNNIWPLIDVRVHQFNKAHQQAANVGVGFRMAPNNLKQIFGFNAFYDYRHYQYRFTHRNANYHQVGLGFEMLSPYADLRLNGYIPIHKSHQIAHAAFDYPGGYFMVRDKFKIALSGFNAEVGGWLTRFREFNLYAAAGPYYFGNADNNTWGGLFRLKSTIYKYLSVEGIVSTDRIFGTKVQGKIAINIPFGCPSQKEYDVIVNQPIERFEIIVLDQKYKWKWNF